MTHHKFLFAIVFVIGSTITLSAQTPPTVNFKSRVFKEDIPYGKSFIIKTPRVLDGKTSNICGVSIFELGKNQQCVEQVSSAKPVASAYQWLKGDDATTTEYELLIKEPLEFNTNYCFQFTYLQEEAYNDDKALPNLLRLRTDNFYKTNGYISGFDIDTILNDLEQEIALKGQYANISIDENRRILFQPSSAKMFHFPLSTDKGIVTADEYGDLARTVYLLEEERKNLQKAEQNIRTKTAKYSAQLELIKTCDAGGKILTPINNAKTFLSGLDPTKVSLEELNGIISDPCAESVSGAKEDIKALIIGYKDIKSKKDAVQGLDAEVRALEAKIGSLTEIVRQGFKIVGLIATKGNVNITDRTKIKAVRIGTAFGASVANLNTFSGGDKEWNPFGYFALKFYLYPVDKDLKDPYVKHPRFFNRSSIFIGLKALGNLKYKGNELDKMLGTNPVLGYSYDLSPSISLDIGAVFFSQKSAYPLLKNETRPPRAALTIGLSFDPDLINKIKTVKAFNYTF